VGLWGGLMSSISISSSVKEKIVRLSILLNKTEEEVLLQALRYKLSKIYKLMGGDNNATINWGES